MSDLVFKFFTHGSEDQLESVKSIYDFSTKESCAWFYSEYTTDPSIMSMLRCLESIENNKAKILPNDSQDRLEAIVEFLVDRLTFIYYDMGTRANGEETFVVINTTGEPLSATENLKPLVINNEINKSQEGTVFDINGKQLTMAKAWEEMENYFWKIRRQKDFDTADNGFKEFLRWVTLLETYNSPDGELFKQIAKEDFNYRFPYKEIPITDIIEIFNVFVKLRNRFKKYSEAVKNLGCGDKLEQKQLFVFLPMLAYLRKNPDEKWRQIKRLWKWLDNLIRIDNVSKTVNDLLSDVILIGATVSDITDILSLNGISATILSEEERFKLMTIKNCTNPSERRSLEDDIWQAQDMEVDEEGLLLFRGEINTMLQWSTPDCSLDLTKFSKTKFKHYLTALKRLLSTGDHTVNDPTRRALLAWRYPGFPWGRSYGWTGTWKQILAYNPSAFRHFIDDIETLGIKHIIQLDSTCNPIVRYPGILAYSNRKNFDTWKVSGYNVCMNSYKLPIPVTLAAIMARIGANVVRNYQRCGDWYVYINKDGELVITPVETELKRVEEIKVAAVDGGSKLHYDVKAHNYEFGITLPLSSAEILCNRLVQDPNPLKKSCRSGNRAFKYKRCIGRRTFRRK